MSERDDDEAAYDELWREFTHGASVHGDVAYKTESFIARVESCDMVTDSSDPLAHLPKHVSMDFPQWQVWEAHKQARDLWHALQKWCGWVGASSIAPPEFLKSAEHIRRIARIFESLLRRWSWDSILKNCDYEVIEYEPHPEITGLETVADVELRELRAACKQLRAVVGYDHGPWYADRPTEEALAEPIEPTTIAAEETLEVAPKAPDETGKLHESGATERSRSRSGLKEPSSNAVKAYRAAKFMGKKQLEVAAELGVSQGTISRWVAEVANWIKAGNVLPDLEAPRPKVFTMDPGKLEQGPRLTTGRRRN